jgi:recombination protein RecR
MAGQNLAEVLQEAMQKIGHCQRCRTLSEAEICKLCNDSQRKETLLCVVESPVDVLVIEQTGYKGYYFVLGGRLSPLEGIGPAELGIDQFQRRICDERLKEVILATNTTAEGTATAFYLAGVLKGYPLKVSRIAQGVPLGGELEFLDSSTLAQALEKRAPIQSIL